VLSTAIDEGEGVDSMESVEATGVVLVWVEVETEVVL